MQDKSNYLDNEVDASFGEISGAADSKPLGILGSGATEKEAGFEF
jgi:hypothetical protein